MLNVGWMTAPVLNHDLPPSKLFSPSLGLSALREALREYPGQRGQLLAEAGNVAATELRRGGKRLALRFGYRPGRRVSSRPANPPSR